MGTTRGLVSQSPREPSRGDLHRGERYVPEQRLIDSDELDERLRGYLDRNRMINPIVRRIRGLRPEGSPADRAMLDAHGYRDVGFRPLSG
jgi:hypothetical protein